MTTPDRFEYDDAAYVLGALPPDERDAFEAHLATCDACLTRVRELQGIPDLLSDITIDDVTGPLEPVPETLWPSLLRQASRRRRRQRWLMSGLGAAAAAFLIAFVVAVWPSNSSAPTTSAAQLPFVKVINSPVRATATLTSKSWGTAIDVHCHYVGGVDQSFRYLLRVTDTNGKVDTAGSWTLPPDKNIDFTTGTWISPAHISKLEITLPDGTTVLRLRT